MEDVLDHESDELMQRVTNLEEVNVKLKQVQGDYLKKKDAGDTHHRRRTIK